jgi:DNA-binding transcriptional regulator LsrR (DeoR family)
MLRSKRREVVRSYISRLVTEAREAGTIRINQPQSEDEDEDTAEEEEAS